MAAGDHFPRVAEARGIGQEPDHRGGVHPRHHHGGERPIAVRDRRREPGQEAALGVVRIAHRRPLPTRAKHHVAREVVTEVGVVRRREHLAVRVGEPERPPVVDAVAHHIVEEDRRFGAEFFLGDRVLSALPEQSAQPRLVGDAGHALALQADVGQDHRPAVVGDNLKLLLDLAEHHPFGEGEDRPGENRRHRDEQEGHEGHQLEPDRRPAGRPRRARSAAIGLDLTCRLGGGHAGSSCPRLCSARGGILEARRD